MQPLIETNIVDQMI